MLKFSKLTRSRIQALGADPELLGQLADCSAVNSRRTNYFGMGVQHDGCLRYDLSSGEWSLVCACGAYAEGDSFAQLVEEWNRVLPADAWERRRRTVDAAVADRDGKVVSLREPGTW